MFFLLTNLSRSICFDPNFSLSIYLLRQSQRCKSQTNFRSSLVFCLPANFSTKKELFSTEAKGCVSLFASVSVKTCSSLEEQNSAPIEAGPR